MLGFIKNSMNNVY